jgi:hypothetical protein
MGVVSWLECREGMGVHSCMYLATIRMKVRSSGSSNQSIVGLSNRLNVSVQSQQFRSN